MLPKMLGLLPSVPRLFVWPSMKSMLLAALVLGTGFVLFDAEAKSVPPLTHAANLLGPFLGN